MGTPCGAAAAVAAFLPPKNEAIFFSGFLIGSVPLLAATFLGAPPKRLKVPPRGACSGSTGEGAGAGFLMAPPPKRLKVGDFLTGLFGFGAGELPNTLRVPLRFGTLTSFFATGLVPKRVMLLDTGAAFFGVAVFIPPNKLIVPDDLAGGALGAGLGVGAFFGLGSKK